MIRYSLCVMKIKLSHLTVQRPSVGTVSLSVPYDSTYRLVCRKSLQSAIQKLLNTEGVLTQQPCDFGKYYTGTGSITVDVMLDESNTKVNASVSIELNTGTFNYLRVTLYDYLDSQRARLSYKVVIK